MARKAETGLSYFPMNADIVYNKKVKLVVAEFGPKAYAVLLPLYCKIYRENGYWIDWCDEDVKLLFAKEECHVELSFANEVVNGCIRRSLFDKAVFDMFGILTSDRIQENYIEAKKRGKDVVMFEEFLCENVEIPEYVTLIPINVNIIRKNVSINPQNKRKEIKEKENSNAHEFSKEYSALEKTKKGIIEFIRTRKPTIIDPYKDCWNIFARERKLPEIKTITDKRRQKFTVRIHEPAFQFLDILEKSKDSDFLMTQGFFSFDWIIENNGNYLKILEGNYQNKKTVLLLHKIM